jgi:hypothetical protein
MPGMEGMGVVLPILRVLRSSYVVFFFTTKACEGRKRWKSREWRDRAAKGNSDQVAARLDQSPLGGCLLGEG